jgi:hypothetical protein
VRWGHGLAHSANQIRAQRVQVDLVAQLVGERFERSRGVVARAIEMPVDRTLYSSANWLEEREAGEG